MNGNEVSPELAATFEIRRTSATEATFSAFGCSYGYGPMIIEDNRLIGVDLTMTLEICRMSDLDLGDELGEQLFFGGEPLITHEDGRLILENDAMKAVLTPAS